jgi:hypothetical protein
MPSVRFHGRVKLMRGVPRNINRFIRSHDLFLTPGSRIEHALQDCERLFIIAAVRRRAAPGGMCMSMRQKWPAVSSPVSRIIGVTASRARIQVHQLAMELVESALGIRVISHRMRVLHFPKNVGLGFVR